MRARFRPRLCRSTLRKGYAFPDNLINISRLRLELAAEPRANRDVVTVSQRLTAMCGGKAVKVTCYSHHDPTGEG